MRSREFCTFAGGTFHPEAILCSQVNCMGDICGDNGGAPQGQVLRLLTSLFVHAGVIQLVITMTFQLTVMADVERMTGPKLLMAIYFSSGILGHLVSALLVPHRPESGPSGALFGVMAVLVVEIIRAWELLKNPNFALLQILGLISILFLCGMLPFVDNHAHFTGFVMSLAISSVTLPELKTDPNDRKDYYKKEKVLMFAGVLIFFSVLLMLFYLFPALDCQACKWLSCVPFTKDFCSEQYVDYGYDLNRVF